MQRELSFRSELQATPEEVWEWVTSVAGISTELKPLIRMSVPAGVKRLADVTMQPGRPLFVSRIYLFGFLPVDYSCITLVEVTDGVGFVEQSPMRSMRLWRHERRIESRSDGCAVEDRLLFEPKMLGALVSWLVERLFVHRHAVLSRVFGAA